jgi:hypothetical protein
MRRPNLKWDDVDGNSIQPLEATDADSVHDAVKAIIDEWVVPTLVNMFLTKRPAGRASGKAAEDDKSDVASDLDLAS